MHAFVVFVAHDNTVQIGLPEPLLPCIYYRTQLTYRTKDFYLRAIFLPSVNSCCLRLAVRRKHCYGLIVQPYDSMNLTK